MKLAKYISTISLLYQIHAALAEGIAGAGSNETGAIYGGTRASRIDGYVLSTGSPRCGGQLIYTDIVVSYFQTGDMFEAVYETLLKAVFCPLYRSSRPLTVLERLRLEARLSSALCPFRTTTKQTRSPHLALTQVGTKQLI